MESQATTYTNWNDLPVKSYDFQAPLGEYGQVRPHYHLLRRLHLFLHEWGPALAGHAAHPAGPASCRARRRHDPPLVRAIGRPLRFRLCEQLRAAQTHACQARRAVRRQAPGLRDHLSLRAGDDPCRQLPHLALQPGPGPRGESGLGHGTACHGCPRGQCPHGVLCPDAGCTGGVRIRRQRPGREGATPVASPATAIACWCVA